MFSHLDWESIGILVFGVIFLAVGIHRIVEFSGLGFTRLEKSVLITFHVIGCVVAAAGFALLAFDIKKTLMQSFFISAFVVLVPIHILVGIKRRIKILDSQ